jgi:hypothetical protein
MKLRRLPIGVQTFLKMRENDFVYVDKTQHVYELAMGKGAYFLSRPRRFGKSLLLSTLKELYEGNRPLFKGLWIEDKWDWSKKHPVIHISFARLNYQGRGLADAIQHEMADLAKEYNIVYTKKDYKDQFEEIIKILHEQFGKVVILIDEYDKPIIDYLEKEYIHQAKINQKVLKTFYSVLKDAEVYIELLFITGVSKFSKVSIFSDLNHLKDLTLDRKYATITGYTQAELESNFEGHLQAIVDDRGIDRDTLLRMMEEWYDGFSWDGKNRLYNPFGTLNFLDEGFFRNFWFITATPSFLINLMKEQGVYEYESKPINATYLEKYDLDNLDLVPLMFQTGYLTIKEMDFLTGNIVLDYPNREVRDGMYQFIIDDLIRNQNGGTSNTTVQELGRAFRANDLTRVELIINTLFADLPAPLYENHKNDPKKELALSERFFHSVIHLLFKYLGIFIESEVQTSLGRADSVVHTPTHIYLFEFKYNRSAKFAMKQLKEKNYSDKYKATGKILVGIGVNFSHKNRKINGWLKEVLK